MKLCGEHQGLLSGDGECYQCEKNGLHELIIKLQVDINLGNAMIIDQKRQIKVLTDKFQEI